MIYKTTDRDLRFALRRTAEIPVVVHNHKTIFMITVDIFPYDKSVSQRPPLRAIEVTEEELTGMLDAPAGGQTRVEQPYGRSSSHRSLPPCCHQRAIGAEKVLPQIRYCVDRCGRGHSILIHVSVRQQWLSSSFPQ